jgi:hypothetical protein
MEAADGWNNGAEDIEMDRAEHLAWCKKRALEYLDRNEYSERCHVNAV